VDGQVAALLEVGRSQLLCEGRHPRYKHAYGQMSMQACCPSSLPSW
jgi:hypothetical protein